MIKIDLKLMGYITTFESVTRTNVKDCFVNKNNQVVFIVKEGQGSKAVGKKAFNIKKLERLLRKKIKVIEFSRDVAEFVKNIIYPLKSPGISLVDKKLIIKTDTTYLKALLLGRDKANLKELQNLVSKYFDVTVEID